MNNKNLLAILGGPHKKGVTAILLDYVICEAENKVGQ